MEPTIHAIDRYRQRVQPSAGWLEAKREVQKLIGEAVYQFTDADGKRIYRAGRFILPVDRRGKIVTVEVG